MKLQTIVVGLLVRYSISELINSIIGQINENTAEFRARSTDGKQIQLYIDGTILGSPIDPIQDKGQYYYYKKQLVFPPTYQKGNHTLEVQYDSTKITAQTKNYVDYRNSGNYSFIVTSYNRNSNRYIYTKAAEKNIDFFLLLGGMTNDYSKELSVNDLESKYNDALTYTAGIGSLLNKPFEYNLNEFCGEEVNEASCGKDQSKAIKKLYLNTYPVPDNSEYTYYSTVKYGIKFIHCDSQSYIDIDSGTLLGATQLTWLISEIESFNNTGLSGLIITYNKPYYYNEEVYSKDWVKQSYDTMSSAFDNEKTKIMDSLLKSINYKNLTKSNYQFVLMIAGGRLISLDKGNNNKYGNFPILTCGPLDSKLNTCNGGPFSHGYAKDDDDQYCYFNIYQSETKRTCLKFQGIIAKKESLPEIVVFTYDTCTPELYNSNNNIKCPIIWKEKIIHSAIVLAIAIFVFVIFYVVIYRLAIRTFDYQLLNKEN